MHLAVLLAYAALTAIMTWPLARHAISALPGDGFDGWQNYWNLWWLKTALVDRLTNPFQTDILYSPTGVGLYFHTLNPLNGLISMPVQVTAGLMAAYNMVVLASWVLAGYGAFLLCLWCLQPTPVARQQSTNVTSMTAESARYAGAFVAGVVFTFAPFHMAHLLGHMQVMSLQWIPFYVLFLLRGIGRSRSGRSWLPNAVLAGLFLVFNGLSDWYFVLYLFLFTVLVIAYYWVGNLISGARNKSADARGVLRSFLEVLRPPAVAGALFVVVLSPVLLPMVREATRFSFMVRPASDLYILSATVVDYLIPSRLHTLLREAGHLLPGNQIAPISERTIAVGYAALALAIVAVVLRRRRALPWVLAALFFLLLSLGPEMHFARVTWDSVPAEAGSAQDAASWTPFGMLNRAVPFMSISRSVSRYALMVQFSMAVLSGIGLYALLVRVPRRSAGVLAATALSLVLAEYWVAPYPLSKADTPAFYAELAKQSGAGAVLNLPMNYDRPGYLLYQTVHGRPLTVAYISRDDPRTLTERVPVLQHFRHLGPDILADDPAAVGLTVLHDLGVQFVVLDRYKMPRGTEREFTEALADAIFADASPVYEDERLTVFEVLPVAEPKPYVELGPLHWGPLKEGGELDTSSGRSVSDGLACLTVKHAPASSTLEFRYRHSGEQAAEVVDDAGTTLAVFEPAPQGTTASVSVSVPSQRAGGNSSDIGLCVHTQRPGTLHVEEIRLSIP